MFGMRDGETLARPLPASMLMQEAELEKLIEHKRHFHQIYKAGFALAAFTTY